MTPEQKQWIDSASMIDLLRKWRFANTSDDILQGESGAYFSKVMFGKRDADPEAWTASSKAVGWGRI